MSRYVLELCYNGTRYNGWQIQKNTSNTIQQVVHEKLSIMLQEEITVTASGRTDAGVHAKQNFAHFDCSKEIPPELLRRLNFFLPQDIAVKNIFSVEKDFNARFDAIRRTYEYLIAYEKNPLISEIVSFYPYEKLSLTKLNAAAKIVKSHSDFAAFSKKRTQVKTTICKIKHAHWEWDDEVKLIRFTITADRFLRGMVRGIVATSIRFAREKISEEALHHLLQSKVPHKTAFSAPTNRLTLIEVAYPSGSMKAIF